MVAIEHHHFQTAPTAKARWRVHYREERILRHRHDGRAEFWQLILVLLAAFWTAVGFGISVLS